MNNLANANLLDDSVSNSSSLKKDRINKTAKSAINPVPKRKEPVLEEEYDDENEGYDDSESDNFYDRASVDRISESKSDSSTESKTILGMKPAMFYTILAVGAIVGGIYVYNKFMKKGKKGLPVPDLAPNTTDIAGASKINN